MVAAPVLLGPRAWHEGASLHPYLVCDVFTDSPLEGNQLAVFLDGRPFGTTDMRRVAREMNYAETVFVLPPVRGGDIALRIFTPGKELPFAGHPVLGAAFVTAMSLGKDEVTIETGRGPIEVALSRDGDRFVRGTMRQPIPTWKPFGAARELLGALHVPRSELPVVQYDMGVSHVYVVLGSEDEVARLDPDLGALASLGVAVNCVAGQGLSWKTRMFYPAVGVAEDAATGSAAGPLAVHLARHRRIRFGDQIRISQGAEIGRPSTLWATARGTARRIESVEVAGAAVVVAEGRLRVTTTPAAHDGALSQRAGATR